MAGRFFRSQSAVPITGIVTASAMDLYYIMGFRIWDSVGFYAVFWSPGCRFFGLFSNPKGPKYLCGRMYRVFILGAPVVPFYPFSFGFPY